SINALLACQVRLDVLGAPLSHTLAGNGTQLALADDYDLHLRVALCAQRKVIQLGLGVVVYVNAARLELYLRNFAGGWRRRRLNDRSYWRAFDANNRPGAAREVAIVQGCRKHVDHTGLQSGGLQQAG